MTRKQKSQNDDCWTLSPNPASTHSTSSMGKSNKTGEGVEGHGHRTQCRCQVPLSPAGRILGGPNFTNTHDKRIIYRKSNQHTIFCFLQHLEQEHQQVLRAGPTNISASTPAGRRTESGRVYANGEDDGRVKDQ